MFSLWKQHILLYTFNWKHIKKAHRCGDDGTGSVLLFCGFQDNFFFFLCILKLLGPFFFIYSLRLNCHINKTERLSFSLSSTLVAHPSVACSSSRLRLQPSRNLQHLDTAEVLWPSQYSASTSAPQKKADVRKMWTTCSHHQEKLKSVGKRVSGLQPGEHLTNWCPADKLQKMAADHEYLVWHFVHVFSVTAIRHICLRSNSCTSSAVMYNKNWLKTSILQTVLTKWTNTVKFMLGSSWWMALCSSSCKF